MKKILLFFCVLQSLITFAQNPADIEHSFGPVPGFGGIVNCMVTQPDGKIIVKGAGIYNGAITKLLIRINPDGSVDPTFDYYGDNTFDIKAVALQPDGKVLIGGLDKNDKNLVIRLNADGSKDTSFEFGAVQENSAFVSVLALQTDGKILVVNKKQYVEPRRRLIRLNADGSLDSTFDIKNGFDSNVFAVAVQSDGKIIAGGSFSTYQGVAQSYLVRLNADGTKDTSFNMGSGFAGSSVASIIIQNDGKIMVGGGFTRYQGVAQKYLVRINPDGSIDTSFVNPSNFIYMTSESVSNMYLQSDGKLLATVYRSNGDDAVYRFNTDGTVDTTYSIPSFSESANILNGRSNADVNAITLLNDGKILIGGKYTYCRDIIDKGIVCLNSDGTRDSSFNKDTGLDAAVFCSAVQTDGKTLIGGFFDNFQGVTQKKLIRLNADGSKDTSFNPDYKFNNEVSSILLQSDGKILVRGKFTETGNSPKNSLVRLNPDGSLDTSFLKRFEYAVEEMALQPDGKILVSAFVDSYPNLPYRKLFRLNIDGSEDKSFKPGTGYDFTKTLISSIVVQPDSKILLGGSFTAFNGVAEKYLIRLNPNGSRDTSFNVETLHDSAVDVSNIVLQPDGKVIVTVGYTNPQGNYQSYLIRLNSDGSKDTLFADGTITENVGTGYTGTITSVVLQPDGKIILGGEYNTYQGVTQNRLTRLNTDGTIDNTFDAKTGFGSPVYTISLFPDGKINVGGVFSGYQGIRSAYFIRLKGTYVKPTVNATTIQTNLTCPGNQSGSASIVSVYDGKSPYTYLWSNGATTATASGLPEGNYWCKITDANSETVTKNFVIITDSDIEKPTIIAPEAVTVNLNTGCTATQVSLGTPVTRDNCTVVSVTNDAPTEFPLGNTKVTWTVKDANNNTSTATQTVTVKDVTLPTITAPAAVTVEVGEYCSAKDVVLGTPTTADNCSVASVKNNAPKSFSLGKTTVTWTVTDGSNNSAKATQIVTVKDTTPPTITAPADVVAEMETNCSAINVVLGYPAITDSCANVSVTNNAPGSFPVGNTTVTWTAKDISNNIATATQIVTVKGIDVTLTYNAGKLSVAETGATYKWMTCNNGTFTTIPNETNPVFTPKQLGSYAVEVTKNGCAAKSTCFDVTVLGTKNFEFQNSFRLYPNPVKDFITIEMNSSDNAKLNVFNVTGQIILSKELKATATKLNISNLPTGVYMFQISNETGIVTKKVIKD
ncbi:putative delta-60 repeat protein/predicted secreted protein (Por secretion system target) [Flavobacterium sp. 90]|uniref:HYR domain-containing protein n=1 Tax=unclassified Flavobacterium TaxID=196869 RepID=UPI000EAFB0E3|nr:MULTISPECIES: HYR domain-containing protein [unclassified Flavobacterium]RKR05672.1 putative delta-60 repeat protein/predicted secreted protein (Por secretion system target) [Flavobacterium sp. 81]TCK56985.1 putative delta-60 repeat protein/predicted secreted protein (Por secretion system target) [Flavobacterium sp. 90]